MSLKCKFANLIIATEQKKIKALGLETEAHREMEPLPVQLRRIT